MWRSFCVALLALALSPLSSSGCVLQQPRGPASVITLKPAIRYQFKTGQRDWPKT